MAPQFELLLARVPATLSLRSFFIATVATQIAVAPLLLYHIGQWSLVAIPVNLLVLPMVPVAMLLTFAAGIVALISLPLALPVSYLATLSLWYIITFAQTFAALPFAAVTVPPFPGILVPIMYAALGCLFWRYWYRPAAEEKLPALPSHQDTSELSGWTVIDEETMSPTITKNTLPPRENSVPGQAESADDLPIFFR